VPAEKSVDETWIQALWVHSPCSQLWPALHAAPVTHFPSEPHDCGCIPLHRFSPGVHSRQLPAPSHLPPVVLHVVPSATAMAPHVPSAPHTASAHAFMDSGQSTAARHATHEAFVPLAAQKGAAPAHVNSSSRCPSALHSLPTRSPVHAPSPARQLSHCFPAASHSPAWHVATNWKPVRSTMHVSSTSPVHRNSPTAHTPASCPASPHPQSAPASTPSHVRFHMPTSRAARLDTAA